MSVNLLYEYERIYGPFVHMAPADKAIWLRFLIQGGGTFAPFEYDVKVGDGITLPPGSPEMAVKQAYEVSRKRIDVVCREGSRIWIIELKPYAGLTAVGQLLGYKDLYQWTFPKAVDVGCWLITDRLQTDMEIPLTMNNIRYTQVGM